MRSILTLLLSAVLAGCAAEPVAHSVEYVPAAWLEPGHIDAIVQRNPPPPARGQFETTRQYEARLRVARDRLDQEIQVPVAGKLVADYDPDRQQVILPLDAAIGFWWDWQTFNGYAVYDRGAEYPQVSLAMPLSLAREDFARENYGLVLIGSLHDYPSGYLAVKAAEVLIYDRRSLRVLARDGVQY